MKKSTLEPGREISIGDLIEKIINLVGRNVKITQSEERMRPAASEVLRLCSDNSKAKLLAGWSPEISLEEGLRATIDWVRKSSHLYDPTQYRI